MHKHLGCVCPYSNNEIEAVVDASIYSHAIVILRTYTHMHTMRDQLSCWDKSTSSNKLSQHLSELSKGLLQYCASIW